MTSGCGGVGWLATRIAAGPDPASMTTARIPEAPADQRTPRRIAPDTGRTSPVATRPASSSPASCQIDSRRQARPLPRDLPADLDRLGFAALPPQPDVGGREREAQHRRARPGLDGSASDTSRLATRISDGISSSARAARPSPPPVSNPPARRLPQECPPVRPHVRASCNGVGVRVADHCPRRVGSRGAREAP